MAPFYEWGLTASRLEPLQGGSLLFTTKFPEIPGTHFIDLRKMKGWIDLWATHWFWTWDLCNWESSALTTRPLLHEDCDYYNVHDLSKIQIHQHDLSIIHLNISLASHMHELKLFLSLLKVSFDIICISERRISKHNLPTININIPGYNIEHTPTESKARGTLI